ncbi:hypothetical protein [Marivirga arenosa]|uniref:Secreted protein n=1 Tax=Marivirga arenosa TaxID=3059076 RepID=A0AA51ZUS4_9BACT|nr:hypothetical protein [Marivirga sp. BKB1-2]WNB16978.1 hypothetical protein QYS47_32475 [Marivirga sp. BKB1-2]
MKSFIITLLFLTVSSFAYSQSIVSYHQSPNGGQAAYAYEFNERFRPEIRLYPNTAIEDFLVKLMFNYDLIDKENHEFYSGISLLGSTVGGATFGLAVGINIYPFENKNFGFLMEFSPNIPLDEAGTPYFSGSWGIRYRLQKSKD